MINFFSVCTPYCHANPISTFWVRYFWEDVNGESTYAGLGSNHTNCFIRVTPQYQYFHIDRYYSGLWKIIPYAAGVGGGEWTSDYVFLSVYTPSFLLHSVYSMHHGHYINSKGYSTDSIPGTVMGTLYRVYYTPQYNYYSAWNDMHYSNIWMVVPFDIGVGGGEWYKEYVFQRVYIILLIGNLSRELNDGITITGTKYGVLVMLWLMVLHILIEIIVFEL